jgi:hypothetical protein
MSNTQQDKMNQSREQEMKLALAKVRTLLGNRIMNDLRSTTDQLQDLYWIANQVGLYDAADLIRGILDRK